MPLTIIKLSVLVLQNATKYKKYFHISKCKPDLSYYFEIKKSI